QGLGIPTVEGRLEKYLSGQGASVDVPQDLRKLLEQYTRSQDVVLLHALVQRAKAFRLQRLLDRTTQQTYLLIGSRAGGWVPLAGGLSPRTSDRPLTITAEGVSPEAIRRFIESRADWLEVRARP